MIKTAIQKYLQATSQQRMDLRTVMFDMDGVLYDSMRYHASCWHRTMEHFGFTFPEWEAYMHEGRTGAGTINIVSMRERGYPASEEECKAMYEYKCKLFEKYPEAQPMPGAYELLKKVKGAGLTPLVVTGSGQKVLLQRLQRSFPGIFRQELMVTAFDVRKGKPDPEPYLIGLEKGGRFLNADKKRLSPCQSVVVENAPLGVQAAVAAGVFTIAVNTGPLPDDVLYQAGANILYPSMQALADGWDELFDSLIFEL